MLHAWRLDLRAPGGAEGAPWSAQAAPPADFLAAARALGLGEALADALTLCAP